MISSIISLLKQNNIPYAMKREENINRGGVNDSTLITPRTSMKFVTHIYVKRKDSQMVEALLRDLQE